MVPSLIVKTIPAILSLVSFYAIEKFIVGDFVVLFSSIPMLLTKILSMFFISIEILSVNENIKEVTGTGAFEKLKEMFKRVKEVKEQVKDVTE